MGSGGRITGRLSRREGQRRPHAFPLPTFDETLNEPGHLIRALEDQAEPPAVLRFANGKSAPVRLLFEILATEGELPPRSTAEIHFSRYGDAEQLDFSDECVVVWCCPDLVTLVDGPKKGERLEDWGPKEINPLTPQPITSLRFENSSNRALLFVVRPDGPTLDLPAGHTMEVDTGLNDGSAIESIVWDGHAIEIVARPQSIARTHEVQAGAHFTTTLGERVWPLRGEGPTFNEPFRYAFSGLRVVLEPGDGWEDFLLYRRLRATLGGVVPGGSAGLWWVVAWTDRSVYPQELGTPYEKSRTPLWLRGDWPLSGRGALKPMDVSVHLHGGQLRGRSRAEDFQPHHVGEARMEAEGPEDPPMELVPRPEVLERRWWKR